MFVHPLSAPYFSLVRNFPHRGVGEGVWPAPICTKISADTSKELCCGSPKRQQRLALPSTDLPTLVLSFSLTSLFLQQFLSHLSNWIHFGIMLLHSYKVFSFSYLLQLACVFVYDGISTLFFWFFGADVGDSEVTTDSVLNNYSWCLGDHIGCWKLNPASHLHDK